MEYYAASYKYFQGIVNEGKMMIMLKKVEFKMIYMMIPV